MAFWSLDPAVDYLNHGSFGACPEPVLAEQQRWRAQMEREPVRFFLDALEPALDAARARLAAFLGAKPEHVAWVHNATTAVNTVLRALERRLKPGDQLLHTNHGYPACLNAMRSAAERAGAEVVVAQVPYPLTAPEQVTEAVLKAVTPRTRWALIDHVTSPTALVFPVEQLVRELHARGVEVMIDGAHAPGMVAYELERLGAEWHTGNLHKWVCAPKGAAYLWTREDKQAELHPLVVSHGATSPRSDRDRFRLEFDYVGTDDMTAYLAVPAALDAIAALEPGGWPAVREKNRALALEGGALLERVLGLSPGAPLAMRGSMYTVELAPGGSGPVRDNMDPLHAALIREEKIEVPVFAWGTPRRRLLRISAQRYNRREQYERLAQTLSLRERVSRSDG